MNAPPIDPRPLVLPLLLSALFATGACAEVLDSTCPGGRALEVEGEQLCVYQQPVVVETGFSCPADQPFQTVLDGVTICSASAELPTNLPGVDIPYAPPSPPADGTGSGAGGSTADGTAAPDTTGGSAAPTSDCTGTDCPTATDPAGSSDGESADDNATDTEDEPEDATETDSSEVGDELDS